MRGLFLVLVPLFPIRGLFLALPLILLSPRQPHSGWRIFIYKVYVGASVRASANAPDRL